MTTEIFIIVSAMWIFGLIAAYFVGVNHGLKKGFLLNEDVIGAYRKAFYSGYSDGQESMSGYKKDSDEHKKKIEQLNRFIVRELKVKKGK